jgi:endonuclease G, mitochondrial
MPPLGYDDGFLGTALPFPTFDMTICAPLKNAAGNEIKYTHFSVFLNKDRRLPLFTAVNIKGEAYSAPTRAGNEPWDFSDQVENKYQLDGGFYSHDENTFDRGHIVRRVDPCWGGQEIGNQAEADTFHWVNCTPQHKKLNQRGGIWYQLEQHIIEKGVKNKIADIAVFAGPVLDQNDWDFEKLYQSAAVQIPNVFWKVIVWEKTDGKLYAVGFMMSQWEFIKNKLKEPVVPEAAPRPRLADDYFENLVFSDHKTYQVSIATIEKATGITFNWDNVSFPYTAKTFKAIRAVPLRNVYRFESVHDAKVKLLRALLTVSDEAVKKELKAEKPLSKTAVKRVVNRGEGYLLKRYEFKNITL